VLANSDLGNVLLGVVATGVAALLAYLGRRFAVPRVQAWISREISITGVWTGSQTSPRGVFGFRMELRQSGTRVHGLFHANDEVQGKKITRIHLLQGEVHHGHVTLTYRNKDPRSVGMGSFLFAIRQGGEQLIGDMLFLQTGTGKIGFSTDLVLERE
jgi:hypothetical protein